MLLQQRINFSVSVEMSGIVYVEKVKNTVSTESRD
ncbi:hypothetical protein NIES4071_04600 [Calothrix sp. NIES-4071]|nr:hypothetical protein NIES4071_04600 [Calothrix sp. NIES-4071]BAZ54806.1 hypothetical protein NIES4105_04590 [Calothrix sp. NIES-4105]